MKIVASTMGKSLEIFVNLLDLFQESTPVDSVGLYVADSQFFKAYSKKHPFLKDERIKVLKEWEITGSGKIARPDWKRIERYEQEIGDPTLWNVLMADRRIFFGRYCKYKQDYASRFNYEQMVSILDEALCRIDEFITLINPDLIIGFGTATFGDYLFYLFASARKIPYLQLKSTKIGNYVALNDSAVGLSSHIEKAYFDREKLTEEICGQARQYLDSVDQKGVRYEGAILSGPSLMRRRLMKAPVNIFKGFCGELIMSLDREIRQDNHLPGSFIPSLHYNLFQPLKAISVENRLKRKGKYLPRKSLPEVGDFVFYPLHFEPEVSLQVFGRAYQNQIELVRNIAESVPVGTKVVVKEHPRSLGFRPYAYYRKLLEIPNVYLVDLFIPAIEIVHHAKLVAVVSGTIGFEAAICKKPVISFGQVVYNVLPDTMVKHVADLNNLGCEIQDLLNHYTYDFEALKNYVGAIITGSVPVDLYTVLFSKSGRFSENRDGLSHNEQRIQGYELLSKYFIRRFNEVLNNCSEK